MAFPASCNPTRSPSSPVIAPGNTSPFPFPKPRLFVPTPPLRTSQKNHQMAGGGKTSRSCARAGRLLMIWAVAAAAAVAHVSGVAHDGGAAPAPAEDCSSALLSLSGCLTFVQEGSAEAKPQKECCAGLKKVVKGQPGCLCDAFNQGASFGVKLNMTKALALPAACGVSTSHLRKCASVLPGGPAPSPAPSPTPSPPPGEGVAPTPSAGHSAGAASAPLSTAAPGTVVIAVVAAALPFYFYF